MSGAPCTLEINYYTIGNAVIIWLRSLPGMTTTYDNFALFLWTYHRLPWREVDEFVEYLMDLESVTMFRDSETRTTMVSAYLRESSDEED